MIIKKDTPPSVKDDDNKHNDTQSEVIELDKTKKDAPVSHKGRVLFDATACPQDIAYLTNIDQFSDA
ncbi:MAG: hypothetical protein EAZ15_02985 [Sphingobacteriales bacterium]|nr:MAG: hypothetical protein EAZ15_02985 [Sphingobacteriales bacterium]